jgi:predicted metal-dependent enzyme (double-stranded beta helix superfamily)
MTPTPATQPDAALAALAALIDAAERALTQGGTERAMCDAMRPAMAALLEAGDRAVAPEAREPFEGQAVGNLLHADPDGRFHVLAVVFPDGTSSGVHHHGCWGLIGYLEGGDEETRYDDSLTEVSRRQWQEGDIAYLLPEEGEGWHRVRCAGATGVSIHVLCRTPAEHPHRFFDRSTGRVLDFPFVEVAPGRWRAQIPDDPAGLEDIAPR